MKRKILALIAAALTLTVLCVSFAAAEEQVTYELGDTVQDFTFTTFDGKEYTLSEVLKEKDMVLLNLWATWCGPCQREFPFMEEAYQEYKDRIEIFALSTEEDDTNEVLSDYVASMGMTFPVGRDTVGLGKAFFTGYIPNTIVIDRNGVVCYHEYGSLSDADSFRRIFDLYVGEDYEGPVLQVGVPPVKPNVEPASAEELAVLNAEGGELAFANPEDAYNWPMLPAEDEGKPCLVSSNVGIDKSQSAVQTVVTAEPGAVLTFDYKVSSEAGFDFVTVTMGDVVTKVASGETGWKTAVVPFPEDAGECVVTVGFTKDPYSGAGEDKAYIANLKVLTGEEAAAALLTLPDYPVSDAVTLSVVTEGAKEIVFDDPSGTLVASFGDVPYYIIPGDAPEFAATLTADYSPVSAVAQASTGESYVLADILKDGAYTFTSGQGTSYSYVSLYPDTGANDTVDIYYFASEDAVNSFVERNFTEEDGTVSVTWSYKEDGEEEPAAAAEEVTTYQLGDAIEDFTFTTYDGKEYTLSEVLKEKDMVLINLWATWCGPCKREFPFMTEAYEEYKDRIEIFALSTEKEDTDEVLAEYVAQNGMTFPVGRDTVGLGKLFYTGYIPNTIVIDRNGIVCYHEYGSLTDSDSFRRIFDLYVGEDYEGPVLQVGVPLKVPDVAPTDPEALAALNAEGGELVFSNPEDAYNWPVVLVEKDGRTAAETTNLAAANGTSAVNVTVQAEAGDMLTFEYKCSTEADYDFAVYAVDGGEPVHLGSGETDWQSGRISFPEAGEYVVTLGYTKDGASDDGEDKVWFANVALIPAAEVIYQVGDTMPDFTFTTYDGKEYTLSETLKEKDMVLINIWATWCGPCRSEFPFMEQDYQKYKDDIEIFALSCEAEDTDEVIADFVKEMGMTFPTGRDTPNLADAFGVTGIPTSIVVDRFGKICCIVVGSQAEGAFERLFTVFVGDEYTESVYLDTIPPLKPDIEAVSAEELAALNAEGGELAFANPEDEYNWPVTLVEKDGRTVAESTNTGKVDSTSLVNVTVTAEAGDALTFEYKTSTEAGYDFLLAYVNGEKVPVDSGEKDWKTAVIPFSAAGEYTVSIGYTKDGASSVGEDKVWFGNVKVLTGEEAAQAIAAQPVYPVSDAVTLNIVNEGAREITFIDTASGAAIDMFGYPAYIIPGDTAQFTATLTEQYSPVGAAAQMSDGTTYMLSDVLVDGVYTFSGTFSGEYDYVSLYPNSGAYDDEQTLYFFNTEEAVDAFLVSYFGDENGNVPYSWAYADETDATVIEPTTYQVGDTMPDFTFTTFDGKTYTLSETLKEKDMVLINLWATWCGPCRMEFPYMDEAYQEYKDKIEIFALSCWEDVTDEDIAAYVQAQGMTFPVGHDTEGFVDAFGVQGIPTSIVVDRFGKICYIGSGSQSNADNFRLLFDTFLGDDYTESAYYDSFPKLVPTVEATDPEKLAAALNTGDKEITFVNPEYEYNWPVILVEKDGRTAAETTCMLQNDGLSGVDLTVNAEAGDVLTFEYKTSTEEGYDFVYCSVNGEQTVLGSGESDWTTYSVPFEAAGEYTISLFYLKDPATDDLQDRAWFANFKLTGAAAEAETEAADLPAEVDYRLIFADQNGDPVPGIMANVCDDDTCTVMTADESGVVAFTKAPFAYHIQVIKVPDGYSFDKTQEYYVDIAGGDTTFTVTKD